MTANHEPIVISVGGGKGGVGKSMVSTNLSTLYAGMGLKVVLLDLDFGAANVHTLFGVRKPKKALGDFFLTPKSRLVDYLLPTSVPGLSFAPGSGYVPELANLKYFQKTKLIKQLHTLEADIIILDLGAGSSYNVVDFFSMTSAGVIVTTPEPTAITNAYEFLKNVVYRSLFRTFRNHKEIESLLKSAILPQNPCGIQSIEDLMREVSKIDPWATEMMQHLLSNMHLHIVFNQAHRIEEAKLGEKLRKIAQHYLSLKLNFAGMIFHNSEVSSSVLRMNPITLLNPLSPTVKALQRIADFIMHHIASQRVQGLEQESFEQQYQRVRSDAKRDYEQTLLSKKR